MTNYQEAKDKLRSFAEWMKVKADGDKPMVRQGINDYTHDLCADLKLSEYQQTLLHNYACKLHP